MPSQMMEERSTSAECACLPACLPACIQTPYSFAISHHEVWLACQLRGHEHELNMTVAVFPAIRKMFCKVFVLYH